jgi:hypothetical protein
VLAGIFGGAAVLIWTGGRLLSGQGLAFTQRPRSPDVQPTA